MCGYNLHLLRQLLVLLAACLYSYGTGILLSFPSILSPALLSPNSTDIKATSEQLSWIAACHGISGFIGFAILSPIFQTVGRKTVNIIVNLILLTGWIILYFANSVTLLICARLIQGLTLGGVFIVAVTLSENSHPSRRGYFMTLKKVSLAIGSLTCHSSALVWTWRKLALLSVIVCFMTVILLILCPESPAYLALAGRVEECRKSFRWLFGQSLDAEKELRELISAQTKNSVTEKNKKISRQFVETVKVLLRKDFQKPFFIVTLLTLAIDSCGRYFMLAYITQIMTEITGDISVSMYCSVAGDCLLIIALSLSCYMIKTFRRRILVFRLGFFSAFLMFLVSVSVIIRSYSLIPDVKWITPWLVLLHSFIAHVGLIPVALTIISEIFPLSYKGLGSFTIGITFTIFYTLTLKLTPVMLEKTGIEGTYAIYGSCVVICLGVLFFILPETKDRTLQDIEDEIRGVKRIPTDLQSVLLSKSDDD